MLIQEAHILLLPSLIAAFSEVAASLLPDKMHARGVQVCRPAALEQAALVAPLDHTDLSRAASWELLSCRQSICRAGDEGNRSVPPH